jgi:hypothetical protein
MKKYIKLALILAATSLLMGCGAAEQMADQCGGDLGHICGAIFGTKNKEQDRHIQQVQDSIYANMMQMDIMLLNGDSSLQTQINQLFIQTAQLAAQMPVISIIDFCGDCPGKLDEVGLRLKTGQIVAYFQGHDEQRYLAVLSPGSYQTTDGTNCKFQIDTLNQVINQHY